MSGDQLLSYLTWAVFVLLFALVARTALQRPHWANLNLVLLFAMPTAIIAIGIAAQLGLVRPGPVPNAINSALLLAIAFFMLRVAEGFTRVPVWLAHASAVGFGVLALASFALPPPRPIWLTLAQQSYFLGVLIYAAVAFVRAAGQAVGVTRRRLQAVAWGSLLLGATILALALAPLAAWLQPVASLSALAAGVAYFIGFAPPLRLRRSWQEPELRFFLATISRSGRQLDEPVDIAAIERATAAALGTQDAWIGHWDEAREQIRFTRDGREQLLVPDRDTATGRALYEQAAQFSTYRPGAAGRTTLVTSWRPAEWPRAVLAAPISAGQRRFGVLTVYTQHAPVVVHEDLELLELLAGQIAVMLETRELAEALSRSRAFSETARMKEDFLSAAAHDLKTPLTTVIGQAQRLERRMRGDSAAAAYRSGIEMIASQAQRLRHIVDELLDASRAERGDLVGRREPVDLAALVREQVARREDGRHAWVVRVPAGPGQLLGHCDRRRIEQLLGHLLDNAALYSPQGGTISVGLEPRGEQVVLSVSDQGIGIPPEDLPRLFSRFFRGSNVDDRRYAGMGLSLFICRAIAEQHGGRIEASSRLGHGSTFLVSLPLWIDQDRQPHPVAA